MEIYSNVFKRFCGALSSAGGLASLCFVASEIASRSFALSANLPPTMLRMAPLPRRFAARED